MAWLTKLSSALWCGIRQRPAISDRPFCGSPNLSPTVGGGATRGSAVTACTTDDALIMRRSGVQFSSQAPMAGWGSSTAKTIDEVRSTSPRADCEASSLVPRDVCTMKRDGPCFDRDGDANSDSEAKGLVAVRERVVGCHGGRRRRYDHYGRRLARVGHRCRVPADPWEPGCSHRFRDQPGMPDHEPGFGARPSHCPAIQPGLVGGDPSGRSRQLHGNDFSALCQHGHQPRYLSLIHI